MPIDYGIDGYSAPMPEGPVRPQGPWSRRGGPAVIGCACLWLAGCATPAAEGPTIREALVGMAKQELLLCAGRPDRETPIEGGMALVYIREGGALEDSFAVSKASLPRPPHACLALLKVRDDRIVEVRYDSEPKGVYAEDHCDEIFEGCRR
jgi:hypothetical protein